MEDKIWFLQAYAGAYSVAHPLLDFTDPLSLLRANKKIINYAAHISALLIYTNWRHLVNIVQKCTTKPFGYAPWQFCPVFLTMVMTFKMVLTNCSTDQVLA